MAGTHLERERPTPRGLQVLRAEDILAIGQRLLQLTWLRFTLHSWMMSDGLPSQRAIGSLATLPRLSRGLELDFWVWDTGNCLHFLHAIRPVHLRKLRLVFVRDLTPAEETLLGALVNCKRLTLCLCDPSKRLAAHPHGVAVKYEPHPVDGGGEMHDMDFC